MAKHTLPDLAYDYGALEPHVSGRIMKLHHDRHHAGNVQGANEALEQLDEARFKADWTRLASMERALSFDLSGHILHSLFWQNLTARGDEQPEGPLAEAIAQDFGTFEAFKGQFTRVASTIMGSGWAALVWKPVGGRLLTTQIHDHQSNLCQSGIPLMVRSTPGSTPTTSSMTTGSSTALPHPAHGP